MKAVDRPSVVAKRFGSGELESDAFVEVETGDGEHVDLHVSPRTDETLTCSMSPAEAWRLCRELARVAAEVEQG